MPHLARQNAIQAMRSASGEALAPNGLPTTIKLLPRYACSAPSVPFSSKHHRITESAVCLDVTASPKWWGRRPGTTPFDPAPVQLYLFFINPTVITLTASNEFSEC